MGRIIKWFLIAIAGVITLLIILALAVIFLVDPNAYRGEIERVVTEQTGRKLAIEGNLDLAFFPWIGLQAGKVQLADTPDFGKAPFFQANHVQLAVKVLPLLQGNLVVDTITLERPQIHLIRNEKGQGNWQTFSSDHPSQPPPANSTQGKQRRAQLPSIFQNASLAGLRIRNGLVTWNDRQTGQQAVITPLNTTVEDVRLGAPITIKANWQGQIESGPDIAGKLTGTVTADQQLRQINASDLDLTLNVAGGEIPGGKQQLRIRAQAAADLGQATYRLTDLRLEAAGMQIIGQLAAQRIEGALMATGQLEVPEFSPRQVLQRLGKTAPNTRDPNVLKRVSAKTELRYRNGQLALEPLTVHLDDSALTGRTKLRNFTGPAADFDLALDRIDVDRYRSSAPSKDKQAAAAPPSATSASAPPVNAGQLPIKTLRTLDLNGHVRIGTLKVSGAAISNADVTIRAKDGHLRVHPLTAALYDGTYQGDMRLDATGKTPRITLDGHLNGVQAGPLLADTASFQKLLGTADLNLNANTRGQTFEDWLQGLTGLARFTFRNGAVKGIDIAQTIREALARAKGEPPPANAGQPQTDFTELGGTLNLDGDVIRNTDFSAKSPLLRVEGQGAANLLKQTVDYHLTVNIVGTLKGQGGKDLEQLRGLPIPLRFTGKLSEPKLSVDLAGLFKKRFEQKRQQLEEKGKEKLEQKLNQQLERLFNR